MESTLAKDIHDPPLERAARLVGTSAADLLNRKMEAELKIFFLIIIFIVMLIGILASAFIVTLNLLDWAIGRPLNTCDHILLTLGISGTFYKAFLTFESYRSITLGHSHSYVSLVKVQLKAWSAFSTYMLTACLCVFYCATIVDFNHRFFVWLKPRISKVVPWLLLVSVVGSLVLSVPLYWNTHNDFSSHPTANLTNNSITPIWELELQQTYTIVSHVFGFFLPLLLGMVSISLILASLCRYAQQLRKNAPGFTQGQLDAHRGTAKMVAGLLLTFISLLLDQALCLPFATQFWINHVFWFIIACCICAHGLILILGNAKLKMELWRILGRSEALHQ